MIWERFKPSRGCNNYRTQKHQDADALYAFESRGFGGEVRLDGNYQIICGDTDCRYDTIAAIVIIGK